jgi:hypothetical protein
MATAPKVYSPYVKKTREEINLEIQNHRNLHRNISKKSNRQDGLLRLFSGVKDHDLHPEMLAVPSPKIQTPQPLILSNIKKSIQPIQTKVGKEIEVVKTSSYAPMRK